MAFPKAIITKPFLISTAEYQEVGQNITLVGYDEFSQKMQESRNYASPMLLNWIEPYEVSGERKTLFYTEVNTNIKAGDKVFIINGSYDSNLLIKKDKYKKGRDGYTVLKVDGCKIALDIDYTGALPYKEDSIDDFIKVYYIDSEETFLAANRQITTRGGKFDYKFNYGQNNIAFIDSSYGAIENWGRNGGVYGVPGFFVREENSYLNSGSQSISVKEQWNNISDKLVYLGSFSVAQSSTYKNNGRMLIMNGSFEYKGIEFREGVAYKWNDSKNKWEADVEYSAPIISKSNFRAGTFKGKFNNGAYGTFEKKISWTGKGVWNGGTILNSKWMDGTMNSQISISPSVKAEKDQYGIPFQKPNTSNNAGFGFNYAIGCDIEKSTIQNGNFYKTKFVGNEGTFSVVEDHILGASQSYDNEVVKAFFDSCEFKNIHIKSGEIKNTKAVNSRFTNIKALNSYFEDSVIKDSTYIGDGVIKILGYDEWNMSEYRSRNSGTYSYINSPNSKVYKFYISKESFDRLKAKDAFFIKGLKTKDASRNSIMDFFDSKFKLSSWTAYYDDLSSGDPLITGVPRNSFYKRGYEIAAFLSTPEENSYVISSYEDAYRIGNTGSTYLRYKTEIVGPNPKKGYSIDIVASRHDTFNKTVALENSSSYDSPIPRDSNYGTEVDTGTASMPNYIGDMVDISGAYVIDADFHSGIVETSDWNSGYHINYNNDVALCGPTSTGRYDMSIDVNGDLLIVNTPFNRLFPEKSVDDSMLQVGDVVFLNSIDYDNRGMVAKVTLMATGSSYSTTNSLTPAMLVNTKVSGTTMSSFGSGYLTEYALPTTAKTGSGSGLTVDVFAKPIGSVISITYSAPMSSGGSYSISFSSSIDGQPGPIGTASLTEIILTDVSGNITGVPGATYTAVGNGPSQTTATGSAIANAIFATGPSSPQSGLTVRYYTTINGSIASLSIESAGSRCLPGQVFRIEGGNATFSISSVSNGEIYSYSISNPGEDYILGDILEIPKPFDPNSSIVGTTASLVITGVTVSYYDGKGLSLDLMAGSGPLEGQVIGLTISNPGLFYTEGEIFTIMGGNLDAIVRIDSVTGSLTRLGDSWKIEDNAFGRLKLSEIGTQSVIAGLTGGGIFYTSDANNRWNYISKAKIDRSKIKSGIFRRPYITRSLIRDASYSSADKDFLNKDKIKNLMVADAIFSSNGNILSSATYMHSIFCAGSDIWNDGIIFKSVVNGMTFSKGTVKSSTWLRGTFNGGTFYDSRSFNARPGIYERNYLSDSLWLYYMKGEVRYTSTNPIYNARYAWYDGTFNGGEFFKSDWDSGTFNGGLFYNSKFYDGTINGGIFGTKNVDAIDTKVYNGTINNVTVNNAYVYADDSSYSGLSYSLIVWNNGTFNSGVFGSNNTQVLGSTISTAYYNANIGALPIKDYKITMATVSVTNANAITGRFEIDATITLKHTYIGDLIINLMSPNGKIINLKRKYSGGANDNMISSVFTSEDDAPSIDIWTAPYTGTFKFEKLIGQGVYYNLQGLSIRGPYKAPSKELPAIIRYTSYMPAAVYDGDRYLVVATASDPTWSGQNQVATGNTHTSGKLFPATFLNTIVEFNSPNTWIFPQNDSGEVLDDPVEGDLVTTSLGEILTYYRGTWVKSYHSNTSNIADLLNTDKTATGVWKLLVMDDAGIDIGFVDEFSLSITYKNSYLIRSYKNDAIWNDGIFNGGQFIDLGIWKKGTFNGGKFISTYGWTESGDYRKSALSENFSWQDGVFNGGEFGNESLDANSTWNKGEFNGGVFKGRLWNDGIFTYGEFKGGSKLPAIGGGIRSESANAFMSDMATGRYYGVWRKGVVSEKKDELVTDKKMMTVLERAVKPVLKGKKASFSNILWIGGTFNHQAGEISKSVWLDGLFKKGKMISSAFNPYVVRFADSKEFSKDDSSIWEDGAFVDGEFHYSKWMQGRFISGTAVGMIWKNGVANYMNAYNVFWENGLWRNGNWNGSSFEYTGRVEDGMAREILNRGIEWSGTSSCHIWNIFESDSDRTSSIVRSVPVSEGLLVADSFATDNQEDQGLPPPFFTDPSDNILRRPSDVVPGGNYAGQIASYQISGNTITFTIKANGNGSTFSDIGIAYTSANLALNPSTPVYSIDPNTFRVQTSGNGNGTGTGFQRYSGTPILTSILAADGMTSLTIQITGLLNTRVYNFMAIIVTREAATTQVLTDVKLVLPLQVTTAPTNINPTTPHPSSGTLQLVTDYTDPNLANNGGNITATNWGILYVADTGSAPLVLTANPPTQTLSFNSTTNPTLLTTNTFKVNIDYSTIQGNTKYYFQTFIKNQASIAPVFGPVSSFTTGKLAPQITFAAPGVGAASTSLSMTVVNRGSANLKCGFLVWPASPAAQPSANQLTGNGGAATQTKFASSTDYSIGSSPNQIVFTYMSQTTTQAGSQNINISLSGFTLEPNKQYNIIAYAIDLDTNALYATSDGLDTQSTTAPFGQMLTSAVPATIFAAAPAPASLSSTGATLNGNLTSTGGNTVIYKGFIYRKEPGGSYPAIPTTSPGTVITGNSDAGIISLPAGVTGTFVFAIPSGSLIVSQEYRFKAFVVTSGSPATVESSEHTFYTLPEVTISNRQNLATSLTARSLTATLTPVTPGGVSATTLLEFSLFSSSSFTPVTTLLPNTKYSVRAKATNVGGTGYYPSQTTYETAITLANVSVVDSVAGPADVADTSFDASVFIDNQSSFGTSKGVVIYPTSTPASKTAHTGFSFAGNLGTKTISGLNAGTQYTYEGFADTPSSMGAMSPNLTGGSGWAANLDGGSSDRQRTYSTLLDPADKRTFWTMAGILCSTAPAYSPTPPSTNGTLSATVTVTNTGLSTVSEYGIIWKIQSGSIPADFTQNDVEAIVNDLSATGISRQAATSLASVTTSISVTVATSTGDKFKVATYTKNQQGIFLGAQYGIN